MGAGFAGCAGHREKEKEKAKTTSVTCRSYIFWEVKSQTTLDSHSHTWAQWGRERERLAVIVGLRAAWTVDTSDPWQSSIWAQSRRRRRRGKWQVLKIVERERERVESATFAAAYTADHRFEWRFESNWAEKGEERSESAAQPSLAPTEQTTQTADREANRGKATHQHTHRGGSALL